MRIDLQEIRLAGFPTRFRPPLVGVGRPLQLSLNGLPLSAWAPYARSFIMKALQTEEGRGKLKQS